MTDQKAKEMALKLVKYYQHLVLEGDKTWELGLETAKFWLKLVESPTPDPLDVENSLLYSIQTMKVVRGMRCFSVSKVGKNTFRNNVTSEGSEACLQSLKL